VLCMFCFVVHTKVQSVAGPVQHAAYLLGVWCGSSFVHPMIRT
jgi:hypothetical protein